MDSKLIKVLAIAALTMMVAGCDDDSGDSSCTNGAIKCEAGAIQKCTDGKWVKDSDCANKTCASATACENAAPTCTAGTTKCEANKLYTCSAGAWDAGVACPGGACENATTCKPSTSACTNGATKCEANAVYSCTNGAWTELQKCSSGCNDDGKTCKPESCTGTEKRCNGAYVMTCTNGSFVQASEPCANGCYNGACKENGGSTGGKKEGDACTDAENYFTACDGNKLLQCDGKSYKALGDCTSLSGNGVDYYCDDAAAWAGEGWAECTFECDSKYENKYVDFDSKCEEGSFGAYVCTKGVSGKVSFFLENYYDTICLEDNLAYTCSGDEGDVVYSSCTKCTSNTEKDVCSGAKEVSGKSSAKIGDPCTGKTDIACDGNYLIMCDEETGKYVSILIDEKNNAVTCADYYGAGFFCDEITLTSGETSLRIADCVDLCDDKYVGSAIDYNDECIDGEVSLNVCNKSDAGNSAIWGYTIPVAMSEVVCSSTTSALYCPTKDGDVSEKSCTSCTSTNEGAVCK